MPDRHGPLRTPVGRFAQGVNGGTVSNGGVVVSGAALDVGEGDLSFAEGTTLGPASVGAFVPEGARRGDEVTAGQTLVHGLVEGGSLTYAGEEPGVVMPGESWIPDSGWIPGSDWSPSTEWVPGWREEPGGVRVLVPNAETALADLGVDAPEAAEPVESGATVEASTLLVAGPASDVWPQEYSPIPTGQVFPGPGEYAFPQPGEYTVAGPGEYTFSSETYFASEVYSDGEVADTDPIPWALPEGTDLAPAPLEGGSFGVGVLAAPDASVAGQSVSPLPGTETRELLQREEARAALRRAGVTDADTVEWLAGPTPLRDEDGPQTVGMLGTETELESFGGVVTGEAGPWLVGVHVARVTDDDHVVAAGVQRTPLAAAGDGSAVGLPRSAIGWLTRGRRLTGASVNGLSRDLEG